MMINSIVFHHTYELEHGVMSLKEPYIAAQQVLTLIHEMVKAKSKIENISLVSFFFLRKSFSYRCLPLK